MTTSFTNYQIRCGSADEVVTALGPLVTNRAFVTPSLNDWVSVYDDVPESEDDVVLHDLLTELSVRLNTDVWVFGVYNSAVFQYFVYDRGELKDAYDSKPDLHELGDHEHDESCGHNGCGHDHAGSDHAGHDHTGHDHAAGGPETVLPDDAEWDADDPEDGAEGDEMGAVEGDPETILTYCRPGTSREAVETLLFEEYVLEEDRCKAFAGLLGIDPVRATLGLELFEQVRSTIPGHREFVLVETADPDRKGTAE